MGDPLTGVVGVEFDLNGLLRRNQHGVFAGRGLSRPTTWNVCPCR